MKPVPHLVLTVVVAGLASVAAVTLLGSSDAAPAAASAASTAVRVAALEASVAALQSGQRDLAAGLDAVALRLAASAPRDGVRPLEDLEATVTRVLAQRESATQAAAALAAASTEDGAVLDLEDSVAALLDPDLDAASRAALWQRLREAGLLDDVVAIYEARAKANPNDPSLQVDLGEAYLQKIFEVGNGPLAGVWADKADGAFDAALALDDHNWEARFTKAVSLSFWPPIFGKQPEAISQLKTLLAQQAGQSKSPQYAQTYVMLGNLYAQQGNSADAQAMWKQGLAEYPHDAALLEKTATP